MKTYLLAVFLATFSLAQTIDEAISQINSIKSEISVIENNIAQMQKENKIPSDKKSAFESDPEYLGRMSRELPQINKVRNQLLGDLNTKLSTLRGKLYETKDIEISMNPEQYDAENYIWPAEIKHKKYREEEGEIEFFIDKESARTLSKNWDNVIKTGYLAIEFEDQVYLVKIRLFDPLSKVTIEKEFNFVTKYPEKREGVFAYSPDGKYKAIRKNIVDQVQGLVTGEALAIIKSETGEEVSSMAVESLFFPNIVKFSGNGQYFAVGFGGTDMDNQGELFVYNSETCQLVQTFKGMNGIKSIEFSPDGRFILAGHVRGGEGGPYWRFAKLDLETGEMLRSFVKTDMRELVVNISTDWNYLVLGIREGGYYGKYKLLIFDFRTSKLVKSFNLNYNPTSVDFSPDNKKIIVAEGGCENNKVKIFEFDTGKELKVLDFKNNVSSVAFSPYGKFFAISEDPCWDHNYGAVRFYCSSSTKEVKSFIQSMNFSVLKFNSDGRYVRCKNEHNEETIYIFRTLLNDNDCDGGTTANNEKKDKPCGGVESISYEGKTYNTVEIGKQCWLKENLDVGKMIKGTNKQKDNKKIEKYCLYNEKFYCNRSGGLYQWNEAMGYSKVEGAQGICPTGWHIPTLAEFEELKSAVNNNGYALFAKEEFSFIEEANSSGFSALLAGEYMNSRFDGYGGEVYYTTTFWGSTDSNTDGAITLRMVSFDLSIDSVDLNNLNKDSGFSVRCVKDN